MFLRKFSKNVFWRFIVVLLRIEDVIPLHSKLIGKENLHVYPKNEIRTNIVILGL